MSLFRQPAPWQVPSCGLATRVSPLHRLSQEAKLPIMANAILWHILATSNRRSFIMIKAWSY
jgi:hypothetical protein